MDPLFLDSRIKIALLDTIIGIGLFAFCVQSIGTVDVITSAVDTCFITAFFSILFLSCDLLHKLVDLVCHYTDLSRTNSVVRCNPWNLFELNMSTQIYGIVCIVFCIVLVALHRSALLRHLWNFNPESSLMAIALAWHLFRSIRCRNSGSLSLLPLSSCETQGLDYGTGMAFSYYYGYLRIILPSTGTSVKGFIEKLENIEDAHNIKFAIHKMLILIPSSSYIPPNFKEVSHQWMESAINLEAEKRDRAGTKDRSYANTVYKIYPGGRGSGFDPVYVAVEGATPLLTFYEIQKHGHPESHNYKQHKQQLLENFYKKLKELIDQDLECRDICELIYYNDYTNEGKVNVAEIILERISKIKNTLYRCKS